MKKQLLLWCLVVFSCIENNENTEDKLTVEGTIALDQFARINLTNSIPFKGIIDSLEVIKSIESKAKVELSNGLVTEILTLKKDDTKFPFFFYRSNTIKGELNKTYTLSISIRGKLFKSETYLPEKPNILNLDFTDWSDDGVLVPESKNINLTIDNNTFTDRYFKVLIKTENEKRFNLARPFIFNTENIFTTTFPLSISYIKFNDDGKKENLIKIGEVINLKLIAITKAQFDFWKSIEGDVTSPLENSSFTNAVDSNISNGAFGYWSGEQTAAIKLNVVE